MDTTLDPPAPMPSASPAASRPYDRAGSKVLDALYYVSAALLAVAAIVYVRLLRVIPFTAAPGAVMYTDLIYVAGIALLTAITLLLVIACRRLQDRR